MSGGGQQLSVGAAAPTLAELATPAAVADGASADGAGAERSPGVARRVAVAIASLLFGMIACQSPLLAVLFLGWVMLWTRRFVLYLWWRESPLAHRGVGFAQALALDRFGGEGLADAWHGAWWPNVKQGAQALFNFWLITLPACALWTFAWYDGWNNSFHKGYEQAAVGPVLGLVGIACFIAVMLYAPIAQARHAATGSWKAFWDFRLVRELARARWLACFALALGYALAALPVLVLWTLPKFFDKIAPSTQDMSVTEAHAFLSKYFFWSALYVVPAFVVLRLFAGWIYASALRAQVHGGQVELLQLHPAERHALEHLELHVAAPPRRGNRLVTILTWPFGKAARLAFFVGTIFLWFTFAAQIFVGQFFNHLPGMGFMQHPLVQLPWFRYVPAALGG